MIKWNEEYQIYVSDDGKIWNKNGREYKLQIMRTGYIKWRTTKHGKFIYDTVHRIVWKTFNGNIPNNLEIDHINRIKSDNRLVNLRCVNRQENNRNKNEYEHMPYSEFGKKFFEHYGLHKKDNPNLYSHEIKWFINHRKCSWE